MNKIALIIIYNHRYDKNIEILEKIYKERFSNIYHLIPFYNGHKDNVIPVYENSYYFQGYVAQGFKHFFKEEYTHYLFIADDLLLNPEINEGNYITEFQLNRNTCFLTSFINLSDIPINKYWPRVNEAFYYKINQLGIEASNELPSYDKALQAFLQFDLKNEALVFDQIWNIRSLFRQGIKFSKAKKYVKWVILLLKSNFKTRKYYLSYPLLGSYSDIFVVSSKTIERFSHYCGVFAATHLHAELAIPTALVLTSEAIKTEQDLEKRGKALWPDGWMRLYGDFSRTEGDYDELKQYDFILKRLMDHFPQNYLYLHPIKLSKWDTHL